MRKRKFGLVEFRAMLAESSVKHDRDIQEIREIQKETERILKETSLQMQETDRKMKEVSRQLGGMGNTNGQFAEEFFYNTLEKTKSFAGIRFDQISNKFARNIVMPDKTEKRAQFDIVLLNGDSLALIEAKYKAEKEDVEEMIEKKLPNFRFLYPEYAEYKVYLGIGSLVLREQIIQEAKKLGIGLMQQNGDAVEYQTKWVRVY